MDGWCNRWVGQVSPSSLDVALISALNISEIVVDKSAVKIHLPIKRKKKQNGKDGILWLKRHCIFFSSQGFTDCLQNPAAKLGHT